MVGRRQPVLGVLASVGDEAMLGVLRLGPVAVRVEVTGRQVPAAAADGCGAGGGGHLDAALSPARARNAISLTMAAWLGAPTIGAR